MFAGSRSIARLSSISRHLAPRSPSSSISITTPIFRPFTTTTPTMGESIPQPAQATGLRKLKILMLHGYTQSGPLFHAKTRALEKALNKAFPASPSSHRLLPGSLREFPGGIQLIYPTAPHRLRPDQVPGYNPGAEGAVRPADEIDAWAWWRRNDSTGEYIGLNAGFQRIADTIKQHNGVDAVIGFSQGGCAAGFVASLLEEGRVEAFQEAEKDGGVEYPGEFVEGGEQVNAPLRFAVSYAGFYAPNDSYKAFYEPKLSTPTLHVIGSLDTVVEESRTNGLVERCVEDRRTVVHHPGGHFVPIGKEQVGVLVGWIRDVLEGAKEAGKEESVEDMDVPF